MVNLLVLPFTYVFLALSHWVDIKNSTTLLWCWIAEGKVFFFFFPVGHQDHTFSFFVDIYWGVRVHSGFLSLFLFMTSSWY